MVIFSTTYLVMLSATMVILLLGLVLIDFEKIELKKYIILLLIGFIATRVISIIYLYFVAGFSGTNDLNNLFAYQAGQILEGKIPYLDFECHYSPYFPYLLSIPYLFGNQAVSILFLFVIFDLVVLVVGGIYVSSTWAFKHRNKFYWIYSFIPFTWLFISYWNQDEVISSLFLIFSLLLITRDQEQNAAIFMGVGFLVTKFLLLIFFIPLFLLMKRPLRNSLLTMGVIVIGYLPFIAVGANVLMPLTEEVGYPAVGSNPWVILETFGISYPWFLPHVAVIGCLLLLFLIYSVGSRLQHLSPEATIVLFSLVYMLVGKKSFSFYIPFFLVFLIIVFMRLYKTHENRKMISFVFLIYVLSFSLLYQSVIVFKLMHVLTLDWIISLLIYSVATISQVMMIWILVNSTYHAPVFHYWRLNSIIDVLKKQTHEPFLDSALYHPREGLCLER